MGFRQSHRMFTGHRGLPGRPGVFFSFQPSGRQTKRGDDLIEQCFVYGPRLAGAIRRYVSAEQSGTKSLFPLEMISLVVILLLAVMVAAKAGYMEAARFETVINIGILLVFAILVLSMLANFASGVSFENLIFAPID